MRIDWHSFISVGPEIHHDEACITGTRIRVSLIVGSIADGMTFDEILADHPQLKINSIMAVLAYSADTVRREVFLPLTGKIQWR